MIITIRSVSFFDGNAAMARTISSMVAPTMPLCSAKAAASVSLPKMMSTYWTMCRNCLAKNCWMNGADRLRAKILIEKLSFFCSLN